ncbi:hypothetical protein MLD38_027878 [Melastoma candidum]|uniref:Uncharacterized protein n=1 Tax=Melastoma candidum TaxID=119954 RepID=A0ACB9N1K7_9MYRT|nr:hypothetical protein MLD38_027878 [Melastoma candidum]
MDPCNSSVGTIAYMSPERINTDLNHGQYDGYAGDIWSFRLSILEFYLGRFPLTKQEGSSQEAPSQVKAGRRWRHCERADGR